jgi:hypothetical protein
LFVAGPYIGITGFSSITEAHQFESIARAVAVPPEYELSPGVLVSRHTLFGGVSGSGRYPDIEMAGTLLLRLGKEFTTAVHFNSRDCEDLEGEIAALLAAADVYASGACRRIQLNITNPDKEALARLRDRFKNLQLILQIPLSIPQLETVESLTEYFCRYLGLADCVLLDSSGGRGTVLSDELLENVAKATAAVEGEYSVGIAGGLSGETVASRIGAAKRVLGSIPLSIDAESKLRGGRYEGVRVGDALNPKRVAHYIREAVKTLS